MQNKYSVSIIMNCHNGEKYLKQSLKSVLNQTFKNWELIFWDNNSTDDSKKIFKSFKDKRLKYFKSSKFNTLYKSRNLAFKKCKGDFICFLDTDDWWSKNKLLSQVRLFKKNKNTSLVFSNYYFYYQKSKKKKIYTNNAFKRGHITKDLLKNYYIGILTVMLKKSLIQKKFFSSKYNIIGDFDLFIHLSLKNYFDFTQKPLAFYRVHNSNYHINKKREYIEEIDNWIKKNNKKFEKKNLSLKYLKIYKFKLKIKIILENLKSLI